MKRLCTCLVLSFCLTCVNVQAQADFSPSNIDFEEGNLSGWFFYTGSCCPIAANTIGYQDPNRFVLTSGNGIDYYGKFPVVAPDGGRYSLKIGNTGTHSQAEKARYYLRVPDDLQKYSLFLRYAVVLENPSHLPEEQPRFEVRGYDSMTNDPVDCIQFSFVSSSAIPGFTISKANPKVVYKTWTTASINLSQLAGRTIALDFASGDCGKGAHFGYGYIDLSCGLFKISSNSCKSTTTSDLTAPFGFKEYDWYDSSFTNLIGHGRVITIPALDKTATFHVVLKPYIGFGCPDTISTEIIVSDLSLAIQTDTSACRGEKIRLNGTALGSPQTRPVSYQWTPKAGLSCDSCPTPIADPEKTTVYHLTVKDATGCTLTDSLHFVVKLFMETKPENATRCAGDTAVFRVKAGGINPILFQWYKNGEIMPGETNDSLYFEHCQLSDTANRYRVLIRGVCDSIWSNPVRLNIFTLPQPNLPDSSLSCSEKAYLEVQPFESYLWSTGDRSRSITVYEDGFYSVQVWDQHNCSNADSTYVNMKSFPIVYAGPDTVLCNEVSLKLQGNASVNGLVKWTTAGGGYFTNPDSLSTIFHIPVGYEGLKILTLQVQNNCGTATDDLHLVTQNKLAAVFELRDSLVCEGSSPVELLPLENGGTFSGEHVSSQYFDPVTRGVFAIQHSISNSGCSDTSYRTIRVVAQPLSSFTYSPSEITTDDSVNFVATSKNAKQFVWKMEGVDWGVANTFAYRFLHKGHYLVMLISQNEICYDTSSQIIFAWEKEFIWAPNVFTPNGDGINDEFTVKYYNVVGGVLKVFNQWGQLVYSSNDLTKGWDGTFEGAPCQPDVYLFTVEYYNSENATNQMEGNVTLLR
jgi:gliding motility-associated-like protein